MTQPVGWHVLSQKYGERLMPDGNFHDVAEVTIQADDGTSTVLAFPLPQYNRENVIAQGNYWYERHADIASIGNG